MQEYGVKELMACWIARDLADGEKIAVGANFPVPRAALLLSHFSHGPNMKLGMGSFYLNLKDVDQVMTMKYMTDNRPKKWAEIAGDFPLDLIGFRKVDAFFISGIQIDIHGNTNLVGIPGDDGKFMFRGPGSIGTTSLAALARRYYIVTEHHNPRIFVEKCAVVSALGYGDGSGNLRESLCLPGKGPKYCITPMCIFDFTPETKRMRLFSVHPGVTIDDVLENTGFTPDIPDLVPETPPPTMEELRMLRDRVDPEGTLR